MPKAKITLGDADRERLCAPEVLEVDTDDIDIDELVEIEDALGLDLVGYLDGWPMKARTMKATVWLGLRRAGIEVPLAELKFKAYGQGVRYRRDEDDEASAGKAEPEEPEGNSPSTPPTDSET
jgi:hypothetical protein